MACPDGSQWPVLSFLRRSAGGMRGEGFFCGDFLPAGLVFLDQVKSTENFADFKVIFNTSKYPITDKLFACDQYFDK